MFRRVPIADRVCLLGFSVAVAFLFFQGWHDDPRRPVAAVVTSGWWVGYDQTHYLRSALAFARGDFTPASHWYLPLYSALAALFVPLGWPDPFAIPDLCCLLASLILSGELGSVLLPGWRFSRVCGLAAFFSCAVAPPVALEAWILPWTSTLAAPCMLGCLLATLTCLRNPKASVAPVLAGFSGSMVAGCRPIDAVLLVLCSAAIMIPSLLRRREPIWGWGFRFAGGGLIGLAPLLMLYVSIWGFHESPYVVSSGLVGFDWRLLGLHWIELMIDARPVLPTGLGLIGRLPFIGIGLLGLLGAAAIGYRGRIGHIFVLMAIGASVLLYLSYRDLHSPGLWTFYNYHYFKWTFGLLGLYLVVLIRLLLSKPSHLAWLLPIAVLGTFWRVVPHRMSFPPGVVTSRNGFEIAIPPLNVSNAIVVAADGPFDAIYFGDHHLDDDGWTIPAIRGFKAMPIEGGMMITPLQRWPGGELTVRVASGISLLAVPPPFLVRLQAHFGLPCWFGPRQRGCVNDILPPPPLAEGTILRFTGQESPFLGTGWSYPETSGRWTVGHEAELRFRLPAGRRNSNEGIVVQIRASALWRPGMASQEITVLDGQHRVGRWSISDGSWHDLRLRVLSDLIPPDGIVTLWIRIAHPHRPRDVFAPSRDARPLGLAFQSLEWAALPAAAGGVPPSDTVEKALSRPGLSVNE